MLRFGIFFGLALASVTPSFGEGMRISMDCRVSKSCAGDGKCTGQSDTILFTLAPQQLDRHGVGTYEITYANVKEQAWADADFTYRWKIGDAVHRLLVTGEETMLWVTRDLGEPISSITRFLSCKVTF